MHREMPDWNERYATRNTPWDTGTPSNELRTVVAEKKIPPSTTLELGCGTGTNAVWLAEQGFRVTAVDISPLAIEEAKQKSAKTGRQVEWHVADLAKGDHPALKRAYQFVFDRGVYHCLRMESNQPFVTLLERVTSPGSLWLSLSGNANEASPPNQGPPRVSAREMTQELEPLFELVQLREFRFDGIVLEGQNVQPLAWSALWRRRG